MSRSSMLGSYGVDARLKGEMIREGGWADSQS
jgi:hypothetical protein